MSRLFRLIYHPHFGVRSRAWVKRVMAIATLLSLLAVSIPIAMEKISTSRNYQLFGGLINHVDTEKKLIALTFDDGPDEHTDQIVSMLDELDVRATFFVIGSAMEKYPEYGRKLAHHGHELGNHTFNHRPMLGVSYTTVAKELSASDALIRKAGYYGPVHFRPPYGKKGAVLPMYLRAHERTTVMWSNHPEDFTRRKPQSTTEIVNYAVKHAKPGDIMILHPWYGRENIRSAIPYIVKELRSQGYEFVTLSELRARA